MNDKYDAAIELRESSLLRNQLAQAQAEIAELLSKNDEFRAIIVDGNAEIERLKGELHEWETKTYGLIDPFWITAQEIKMASDRLAAEVKRLRKELSDGD